MTQHRFDMKLVKQDEKIVKIRYNIILNRHCSSLTMYELDEPQLEGQEWEREFMDKYLLPCREIIHQDMGRVGTKQGTRTSIHK